MYTVTKEGEQVELTGYQYEQICAIIEYRPPTVVTIQNIREAVTNIMFRISLATIVYEAVGLAHGKYIRTIQKGYF
jgi:hypothetical protein